MPIGGNFVSCSCCGQGEACESRTTALSTAPLCLGDGTPIAVVVTRGCDGSVTQDGYLDLTTGEYVEGAPPEGAGPCAGGQVESPGDVSPGQPVPEPERA